MSRPVELTSEELEATVAPDALLARAWELEPWLRYTERDAALDRLDALLAGSGVVIDPPHGRDWRLELLAERAIDAGRSRDSEAAIALADQVQRDALPHHRIALGRAMFARAQALAWLGTEEANRQSGHAYAEAAKCFEELGNSDWQGSAIARWGFSGCYQHGDLVRAEELIRRALTIWEPGGQRLAGALPFYADVLVDLGEFDAAEEILDQAVGLIEQHGFQKGLADIANTRARITAGRGLAIETAQLLREAEMKAVDEDWFGTHMGLWFLLEAAELLDRVGLSDEARTYFERGRERAGDRNEEVMQAGAMLLARSGDPVQALEQLQALARGDWLEKRLIWRHTLMTAWATFRVGRAGAGELAARALTQARDCGTVNVALAGEPDLVAALTPEAERSGSPLARALLLGHDRQVVVRLFGTTRVRRGSGEELELPAGMPGELVRLLGLHADGLPIATVLQTLFPQVDQRTARERLRQVLKRLRARTGELVIRDGERLALVPAWVDVREFISAAARVRPARQVSQGSEGRHASGESNRARAVQLAYAALALCAPGELLPEHPYTEWAEQARKQVDQLQLELLELIAADATRRGSNQEALTALEAAIKLSPDDAELQAAIRTQLEALGRHRASQYFGS